jgi:hypothetical protein
MITLLIRESYRPIGFKRTLDSIRAQTFKNVKIIVSYDDERALTYIPDDVEKIQVFKSDEIFFYDGYVNTLKSLVTEGWFGVIDSGDTLASPTSLEALWGHLKSCVGVICQMSRNGRIKPKNQLISERRVLRGKIGMPCLFLHHSYKDVAHLDGSVGGADYLWIKAVSRKVRLKFIPLVVVDCGERDNGVMES